MLENPRAAQVKAIGRLASRQTREETRQFLVEGPQAVSEAIAWRADLIDELYATPTAIERHREIAEAAESAGIELEFVTEDVLLAMADTVTPQGFVAVVRQFPVSARRIFEDSPTLVVILEEVRDPGNLGTIIRAADAAGADAIVLTGRTVDLYNPKVVRSTTGSIFHLPIAVGADLEAILPRAREAGLQILAADIKGDDLLAVRRDGGLAAPTAWLFGNEAHGLPDDKRALADRSVSVPIYGHAESMNLATAASVCLFESAFAQQP
ncbi:TrmH family RNA methyltransferase [Naasia lichenicola]|uniref:RNA methyltransferase n=1 Tax=Naasia lichenicola TaxID=2565933 RepID=A0A4S4FQW6_9MICO|nr:RNA methyltransferase [Naasia lichenicola]THG32272.1 RNA methyltransferase [Naasia lichenicola]